MKVFRCTCPEHPVLFFENIQCGTCGRLTGFCPDSLTLKPFVPARQPLATEPGTAVWADDDGLLYLQCSNWSTHAVCNWMVPLLSPWPATTSATDGHPAGPASAERLSIDVRQPRRCRACRLNQIIPDLTVSQNVMLWGRLEAAKRRCLYSLLSLRLPVGDAGRQLDNPGAPEMAFRFLADSDSTAHFERPLPGETPVLTGHQNGLITINLAEADDIARTRMRVNMEEHYRTLLGHFRHESGHYYWDILRLADPGFLDEFRAGFGDERENYAAAVQRHYAQGPIPDWQQRFVSPYAATHPWEDWAETWAHYLHIVDTQQTRDQFGEADSGPPAQDSPLQTAGTRHAPGPDAAASSGVPKRQQPTGAAAPAPAGVQDASPSAFRTTLSRWIKTSIMLNSLNRSMGLPDPYPFVLNREVRRKLLFVDTVVRRFRQARAR